MLKLSVYVETVTLQFFKMLVLVYRSIYGVGRHASENLANIMSVNSILVHCDIIHSSYMRGTQAPVAYNFFPNASPGQKILEAPHNLIYLPVTVDVISTWSVWLLDLGGEELTIHFQLRERSQ